MDPNKNLEEQRGLAKSILAFQHLETDPERLAELVLALDEWIQYGGFLPDEWISKD